MSVIRILIVDDHAMLRSALRVLIEEQNDMKVVGEAGDLSDAIDVARTAMPDVISLDLSMPGDSGMSGVGHLRAAAPGARILVLTMHEDPAYVRSAIAMGAWGYVVKSAADSEFISAIRTVNMGQMFVNMKGPGSHEALCQSASDDIAFAPIAKLSQREREVLIDVARGHTSQEIADRIGRSIKTVESYRARMMHKLGLKTRVDLTTIAIESGLLRDHINMPSQQGPGS